MKIGIIGLPYSGKTTLFELLTKKTENKKSSIKNVSALAEVPDDRINFLADYYKPKKISHAKIEFVDTIPLNDGSSQNQENVKFLDDIRKVDALIQVVGVFHGETSPIKAVNIVNSELLLADLFLIEKRIESMENAKKKELLDKQELSFLKKCRETLENEMPLNTINFSDSELIYVKNYSFLSAKPQILILNLSESEFKNDSWPDKEKVIKECHQANINFLSLSCLLEKEISELDLEDQQMFMEELDISEPIINILTKTAYNALGLISFFTVGADEVKAWTITSGTNAKQAAGKIHSDIERGFIRAEVYSYNDFKNLKTVSKIKEAGLLRLDGKDYIVQDGDIINFRFNV